MITAQEQAESLLRAGYTEVQTAGELHVGQQYPEAIREGTAVIERIFTRGKDVELIARRDKPEWGPNDTHGFWANYHTAPVHNHLAEAGAGA